MPLVDLPVAGAQVRPWQRGDEASLARHANNRNVWINLTDRFPHPYTPEDAERWIGLATSQDPPTHFAIAVGGAAVGGIGFELQEDVYRRSAALGFWLGEPYWGRGITTAAVKAVAAHAFAAFDLCRLFAHVYERNAASMRVLEKAGFMCEARLRQAATKDGKTFDLYVYSMIKE
jgi:RimJ/RimL family protein N-acetyltransferase